MNEDDAEEMGADHGPSKSALKREAAALQTLAVEIARLPLPEIEALALPEKLHDALLELRRLTSNGALVRQRQYIGKLMRRIDSEPLRARLEERKRLHDGEIRRFQRVERWRDRLLEDPGSALPALLEEHPNADRALIERLIQRALSEKARGRSPAAARELFAQLRQLLG